MTELAETTTQPTTPINLLDKSIWIIDNAILDALTTSGLEPFRDDLTLSGSRPIDRGTLLALVNEDCWGDDRAVKLLCEELLQTGGNIMAFGNPSSALNYISKYGSIPDAIIYDLDYGQKTGETSIEFLERILANCLSVIQVYANNLENFQTQLDDLLAKYSARLQKPQTKLATKADQVSKILNDKLSASISTKISTRVRLAALDAVEKVLVSIDNLPISIILKLIAQEGGEAVDHELVELISVKVGEAINASDELKKVVAEYADERGLAKSDAEIFIRDIVSDISSTIKEKILYDSWLFEEISSSWEKVKNEKPAIGEEGIIKIREFFAYRLFDHPNDLLVRTGDIVTRNEAGGEQANFDELYLVITPPCDLPKFLKKTKGILTLIRLYPITPEQGIKRMKLYDGTKINSVGNSITAQNPFIIPSICLPGGTQQDYCLFIHEVTTFEVNNPEFLSSGYSKPLHYRFLPYKPLCKLSEPFLSGILTKIGELLFRPGIPNFPPEEVIRLQALDKQKDTPIAENGKVRK